MHSQYEGLDAEIRQWMADRGWVVTTTHFDFDREVLAWRHGEKGEPSITLRIGRQILDAWERSAAPVATTAFEMLGVTDLLKKTGNAIVRRDGNGQVTAKSETY